MADQTRLFFLDFGLTNMQDGVLQGRILTSDGNGKGLKAIVEGLKIYPDGIAIVDNHIYLTGMGNAKQNNGSIHRVDLDGKNFETIIPPGVTFTPKQLQAVPEHRKLYWCDREGMRVMRSNFDGSDIETLVTTGTTEEHRKDARRWCVGIAVDPRQNILYWTQKGPSKGSQGRLYRAGTAIPKGEDSLSRSDITLLLDNLPEPIDLDLNPAENALYLTDRGDPPYGNSISKIQLHSGAIASKKILVRKLHEAIGLTLDSKSHLMYFTDLNGSVYRSNMDGTNEIELFKEIGDLTGIVCLVN